MELAIDLYKQMGQQGLPRDRQSYQLLVDVYVKVPPTLPWSLYVSHGPVCTYGPAGLLHTRLSHQLAVGVCVKLRARLRPLQGSLNELSCMAGTRSAQAQHLGVIAFLALTNRTGASPVQSVHCLAAELQLRKAHAGRAGEGCAGGAGRHARGGHPARHAAVQPRAGGRHQVRPPARCAGGLPAVRPASSCWEGLHAGFVSCSHQVGPSTRCAGGLATSSAPSAFCMRVLVCKLQKLICWEPVWSF